MADRTSVHFENEETNMDKKRSDSRSSGPASPDRTDCTASSATGSSDLPTDTVHLQIEYESILHDLRDGIPYKRLNILLLGTQGCGKSSLANSLLMSINPGGYKNVVREPDTRYLNSYDILEHFEGKTSKFICQPRIFECPGLPDIEDDNCITILRLILNGQMKEGVNIKEWLDRKLPKMKLKADKKRMIHVVIVVHSADEEFPDHLISNINSAVHSFKGGVADLPILGVITKVDRTDKTKLPELSKEFASRIGLRGVEENIFDTNLYQIDNPGLYEKNVTNPNGKRIRHIDQAMCQLWCTILRNTPDSPRKEPSLFSFFKKDRTL